MSHSKENQYMCSGMHLPPDLGMRLEQYDEYELYLRTLMCLVILASLWFCGLPAAVISGEVYICSVGVVLGTCCVRRGAGLAFTGFTFCVSVLCTHHSISVKLSWRFLHLPFSSVDAFFSWFKFLFLVLGLLQVIWSWTLSTSSQEPLGTFYTVSLFSMAHKASTFKTFFFVIYLSLGVLSYWMLNFQLPNNFTNFQDVTKPLIRG